jgi:hypothetical protein
MAYTAKKVDVWVGKIADKPGALADKLAHLAEAGVGLRFVLARRDEPGSGLVFLAPLKGVAQAAAARKAGLHKAKDLAALCVEGPDRKGVGAALTKAIADAGINLRGLSAIAVGRKCACYLAFDSAKDAAKAARVIAKII